jgi:hypothetical protein
MGWLHFGRYFQKRVLSPCSWATHYFRYLFEKMWSENSFSRKRQCFCRK